MKSRVIFINLHYLPDVAATGQYIADLAGHLIKNGYQAEVWCGRAHYRAGTGHAAVETLDGVLVRRFSGTAFGRSSTAGRLADYLTYVLRVGWSLLRRTGPGDIIISLTTPPLVGVLVSLLAGRKSRHIHWVMDLHPEAEAALGMLSQGALPYRFLAGLMRWSYRKADAVVALGPAMHSRLLEAGISAQKLHEIPIWGHDTGMAPGRDSARRQLWPELPDGAFQINYSGNLGMVHDADTLLETMTLLRDEPVWFTFSGDGPRRRPLEEACRARGLTHVVFKPYVDRSDVPALHAAPDVHWFSLAASCSGIAVPSKLLSYMASQRPVLFVGPAGSDPAQWILASGCGLCVPNGDAKQLADEITSWRTDPENLKERSRAGFRFYQLEFTPETLFDRWNALLHQTGT